jgi:hypothetical protein
MSYRIYDATGITMAIIRFHPRTSEELITKYLEDMCKSMDALGAHTYAAEEDF